MTSNSGIRFSFNTAGLPSHTTWGIVLIHCRLQYKVTHAAFTVGIDRKPSHKILNKYVGKLSTLFVSLVFNSIEKIDISLMYFYKLCNILGSLVIYFISS